MRTGGDSFHFLHQFILINEHRSKEDDLTVAEELLLQVGPKHGYYPKPSKSYLIVKEEHFDRAKFIFKEIEFKITKSGQRLLGAAIGNKECKREYIESTVNNWNDQLPYW